jgi:hypothetical protein
MALADAVMFCHADAISCYHVGQEWKILDIRDVVYNLDELAL